MAQDPVCKMKVEERKATATAKHTGRIYYFCSEACKKAFEANPDKYTTH